MAGFQAWVRKKAHTIAFGDGLNMGVKGRKVSGEHAQISTSLPVCMVSL